MNKREQVIEILKVLLKSKQTTYSKEDVEKAIMECRGGDHRTLRNWFRYLWRMGYFLQPQKDMFQLNFEKVVELELDEVILNPTQKRLFNV